MILNKQIMNLKFNCWITVVPTIMRRLSDPFFPEFFFIVVLLRTFTANVYGT